MTIPAGFGQMSVVHVGGGIENEAIWTLGFDNNAGDTAAEIATFIQTSLASADYLDLLSSSVTVSAVRVKLGPDSTGPSAESPPVGDGTIGGNAAPPNLAVLVHKNTSLGGRHGRGRIFQPGLAEASLDANGLLTSAYRGTCETFWGGFGAGLILASLPPHLLHADAVSPTAIDTMTVDIQLATQRRRLRR